MKMRLFSFKFKSFSQIKQNLKYFSSLNKFDNYFTSIQLNHQIISEKLMDISLSSSEMARLGKEFSLSEKKVYFVNEREKLIKSIKDLDELLEEEQKKSDNDSKELTELAIIERDELKIQLQKVEDDLLRLIMPTDVANNMNVILEIRAGTGGEEASLFASEMYKMYEKYAITQDWRWEILTLNKTEIGGFSSAQVNVSGDSVFKKLRYESGVHRVQRIPVNDVKIQTSAASVFVLPEPTELDIQIKQSDLRVDVYRSSGCGGQSVNTTDSAVRITHLPTGIVVTMQDERSQLQNRKKALQILTSRVYELERAKLSEERAELRSKVQGTGDRSDKIRTYNFPQDRITDHRISYTVTGIERFFSGELLDDVINQLIEVDEKDRLEQFLKKFFNQ